MADKLMYIPMMIYKITPAIDYNCWWKRLKTSSYEPTNQNSTKVPKGNKYEKVILKKKTLGNNVINSPMSPLSMEVFVPVI